MHLLRHKIKILSRQQGPYIFRTGTWNDVVYNTAVFLNRRVAGSGRWPQLHRAARSSLGICHFSFLSNFHE